MLGRQTATKVVEKGWVELVKSAQQTQAHTERDLAEKNDLQAKSCEKKVTT